MIQGESVFCESCGTENSKKDFNEQKISNEVSGFKYNRENSTIESNFKPFEILTYQIELL